MPPKVDQSCCICTGLIVWNSFLRPHCLHVVTLTLIQTLRVWPHHRAGFLRPSPGFHSDTLWNETMAGRSDTSDISELYVSVIKAHFLLLVLALATPCTSHNLSNCPKRMQQNRNSPQHVLNDSQNWYILSTTRENQIPQVTNCNNCFPKLKFVSVHTFSSLLQWQVRIV